MRFKVLRYIVAGLICCVALFPAALILGSFLIVVPVWIVSSWTSGLTIAALVAAAWFAFILAMD